MPSRPARRADDKRLKEPGKKVKLNASGNPPRTRLELWAEGKLKVSDMTDKELVKGRFADKDGKFKGRPPTNIPRKFFDELHRERISRWERSLQEELTPSLNALRDIRDNPRASADARHKSAVYLIERVVGKVPEKSEVQVEVKKWEVDLEGILTDVEEKDLDEQPRPE